MFSETIRVKWLRSCRIHVLINFFADYKITGEGFCSTDCRGSGLYDEEANLAVSINI